MITPEYQRFWTADVALGMAHLYSCKIEHRDLKTHNVLLCVEINQCVACTR
jgi:serine/threonine protein kinase